MKPRSAFVRRLAGGLVAILSLPFTHLASPQEEQLPALSELHKTNTELKETQRRLQAYEAENVTLHRNNELTTQSIAVLTQSLAEANAEAELFRRQYASLKLRMEALGLGVVTEQRESLEQRLLRGVRDLELLQRQKDTLSERLLALAEAVFRYLKGAPEAGDARTRLDVESELRATNEVLGSVAKGVAADAQAVPPTLQEGIIVSVKEDWSLVVANVGSKHGVRLGMPLTLARGNVLVGRARVVDVREAITGAIIEERGAGAGKVKVGDQVRVEVQDTGVLEK